MKIKMLIALSCFVLSSGTGMAASPDNAALQAEVDKAERAFAATMANRDHEAFKTFLAEETIFFNGEEPLRGQQAVADAWAAYFTEPQAPFSWAPRTVEVLDSGTLALSTGPVLDAQGNHLADFQSIWRRNEAGEWRVVFDKGARVCP